jgi:hypothetical protein
MTETIRTLFKNGKYASVRDYQVEKCIKTNTPMIICYANERMTLSVNDLKNKQIVFSDKKNQSVWKADQSYSLISYAWHPDSDKTKQLTLV